MVSWRQTISHCAHLTKTVKSKLHEGVYELVQDFYVAASSSSKVDSFYRS